MEDHSTFFKREWEKFLLCSKYAFLTLLVAMVAVTMYAIALKPLMPAVVTYMVYALAPLAFVIAWIIVDTRVRRKFDRNSP